MDDWDYEEMQIIDRYSGYKAQALIWEKRAEHYKELLRRAAEFLEINNPILKEIKKELADGAESKTGYGPNDWS